MAAPRPRWGGTRRRTIPLTFAAVALAGAVLSGCGTSRTLDPVSAAREIATGLAKLFQIPTPHVSCPPGVTAQPGQKFSCTTAIDGQPLTFDATVTTRAGVFQGLPAEAVIVVANAENVLAGDVGRQVGGAASVTCAPAPALLVERPGQHFECTARVEGVDHPLDVRVTGVSGNVTFTLEPASLSSTPGTTAPASTVAPVSPTLPGD